MIQKDVVVYPQSTDRLNTLESDKKYTWHPFTSLREKIQPLPIKKAKACTLYLEDGTQILDAVSSWWTNIHGHGNEELVHVLTQQALELDHVIFAGFTHQPAVGIAQQIIQATDHCFEKVFFSDDGSTAVEVGMKLALQYWSNQGIEKTKIITLEGAYHGDTFGSMSLAGKSPFFKPFNDKLFDVHPIDFPTEQNKQAVYQQFENLASGGDVACFVFEPKLQGAAGMRMYSEEILQNLFQIAKTHDVLLVADEVLTGFGRTGTLFSSINGKIKPDVMALSKGLTGGILPLGLTLANSRIIGAFDVEDKEKTFYHGHSFTANAITCQLAIKSLEMLQRPETLSAIERIHQKHLGICAQYSAHPKVKNCRVMGTILALEIETGESSSYFNDLRDTLYLKAISKGVLLRPLGNVLYVLPPYVITDPELQKVYGAITEILNEI